MVRERATEECLTLGEAFDEGYEQGKADMLDKIILAEKSKFYCDELSCNEFKNCSDCMVKYLEELKEHNNGKE